MKFRSTSTSLLTGVTIAFVGLGIYLLGSAIAQNDTGGSLKELEQRLPAEIEYWLARDEFIQKWQDAEHRFGGKPDSLEEMKKSLSQEENRRVKHLSDLHGLGDDEFLGGFDKWDQQARESVLKKNPELHRKSEIYRLRSTIASIKRAVSEVETQKPEAVVKAREVLRQFEAELARLESEEARFNYPRPKDEEGTFFPLELRWWQLKEEFLGKYLRLSPDSESYWYSRWELVQSYREKLRDLMRSKQVQPAHYQEYQARRPFSLEAYVQKHPEERKQWQKLQGSLPKQLPGFHLEKAEGMAMVVGSVVECSVPPVRCRRGSELRKGKPISGIEIMIKQTEGELTEQDVPGGAKMLLPPTFRTRSDDQGRFIFPSLPVREYIISAEIIEEGVRYRSLVRKFFIQSSEEVLILDLPAERLR